MCARAACPALPCSRIRLAFTTARRPRNPASRSRLESSRPMLAPRPIRLPSKRRDCPPVLVPARRAALRMRPPYLTVRLPSLPRFLPSSGVKSSSGIARRPSLANQARERRISAIPTPLVSRPRPGISQIKDVQTETYVALRDARSEEHTSELKSLMRIPYAVFCLKKKINTQIILSSNSLYLYPIVHLLQITYLFIYPIYTLIIFTA